jgi:hypothetical protein
VVHGRARSFPQYLPSAAVRSPLLLGGVLSFFLATLISLIVLMDHPFRGEMGVSASAFELVYDQLMKP